MALITNYCYQMLKSVADYLNILHFLLFKSTFFLKRSEALSDFVLVSISSVPSSVSSICLEPASEAGSLSPDSDGFVLDLVHKMNILGSKQHSRRVSAASIYLEVRSCILTN